MVREQGSCIHGFGRNGVLTTYHSLVFIRVVALCSILGITAPAVGSDTSSAVKGVSRRINLDGPCKTKAMPCNLVQILDSNGEPIEYFMNVDSVSCADAKCKSVTVRIYFDPLGNYKRYKLPSGGILTKRGHKLFTPADHERLHQLLSNPYSQLKTLKLDQITMPEGSTGDGKGVDGISGATVLSKRNLVVVGAAYTCLTLWHWSHGKVVDVIHEMTVRASDKQDLIRYLRSGEEKYVVFALDQLRRRESFDAEAIAAVTHVMRHGSEKLADPVFRYLARASSQTGVDYLLRCGEDENLVKSSLKRVQFLEALKDTTQTLPSGCLDTLSSWLKRADSYYEVHLLLSLLERESATPDEAVRGAVLLLENDNALVVRRSYRYLKSRELNDKQQKALEAFEQQHPAP